jgi:hypothetical protein
MIYLGTLITAASGRLNGSVFSRNRGGPYIRAWVQPDETATAERQAVWDAMTNMAARWPTLAPEQRQAWAAYSLTHHRPNRLGISRPVGGFQEFTRANFFPQQANNFAGNAYDWRDDPPDDSTAQPSSPVAFAVTGSGPTWDLEIEIPPLSGYGSSSEDGLSVYASGPLPSGRHSWPGPYTLIGSITNPGTGSPFTLPLPAGGTSGQVHIIRARYFDHTGRLTARQSARVIVP